MERGLPTHRAPGAGRTAVYAYTAELDEWLRSRPAPGQDAADAGAELAGPAGESDLSVTGGSDAANAGMIAGPGEAQTVAIAAGLEAGRRGFKPGWRVVFAGILAAAAIGAAAYAAAFHSTHGGIAHRISSMFLAAQGAFDQPGSVPLGSAAVSDAEKARAHEFYLKGRYEWSQRTPDSLNRALDDFMQAVVHDPNSAEAYAGLADTYNMQRIFSTLPPADMYPRAIAAARRAVELDDSLAEGHRALAFAEMWSPLKLYSEGEKEFHRAIELNPKDPLAHLWLANALSMRSRIPESLEEISKAQELDPASNSVLASKGIILWDAGKKEEGTALLKQVERADPGLATVHTSMAAVEFDRRNYPAYLVESEKAAELHNDPALRELTKAARAGYARGGEHGLSEALFVGAESCTPETELPRICRAYFCVRLGMNQEALQLLDEANANHDPEVAEMFSPGVPAQWNPIKGEPRFQALMKRNDFPEKLQPAAAGTALSSDVKQPSCGPEQH